MFEVDVIIPFHRGLDEYLLKAIESAENSEGVKVRLLLVNDRKRDVEATSYLRSMGYLVLDSNELGYSECLNLAVSSSNSKYVAQLNSDDLHHPRRLQRQIELMRRLETPISLCRLQKFEGNRTNFELSGKQPREIYSKALLLLGAYGANASVIFQREFLSGKVWKPVSMCDWYFAFEYYPESIAFLDEKLYFYRMHFDQLSRKPTKSPAWMTSFWESQYLLNCEIRNPIPNAVIDSISFPASLRKLNHDHYKIMQDIFANLLIQVEHYPEKFRHDFINLLARRYLISALSTRQLINLKDFSKLLGSLNLSSEFIKMSYEYTLNMGSVRRQIT